MNFIIVGCGRVGAELAYRLFKGGHQVVVVDSRKESFNRLHPDFRGRTLEGEPAKLIAKALSLDANNFKALSLSGTIAYEIEHISNHDQRQWLREFIESGQVRTPLPSAHREATLQRLIDVEVFERFRTAVDVVTTSEVSVSVTVNARDRRTASAAPVRVSVAVPVGCSTENAGGSVTWLTWRVPSRVNTSVTCGWALLLTRLSV